MQCAQPQPVSHLHMKSRCGLPNTFPPSVGGHDSHSPTEVFKGDESRPKTLDKTEMLGERALTGEADHGHGSEVTGTAGGRPTGRLLAWRRAPE